MKHVFRKDYADRAQKWAWSHQESNQKGQTGTVTERARNKHDSPRARLRMYPEVWTRVEAPTKRPADIRYCVRDGKQEKGFQNISEAYELGSHKDYKESNRPRKHGRRPRFGGVPEDDRSSLTNLRFCYLLRETALLCGRGYSEYSLYLVSVILDFSRNMKTKTLTSNYPACLWNQLFHAKAFL